MASADRGLPPRAVATENRPCLTPFRPTGDESPLSHPSESRQAPLRRTVRGMRESVVRPRAKNPGSWQTSRIPVVQADSLPFTMQLTRCLVVGDAAAEAANAVPATVTAIAARTTTSTRMDGS